MHKLKQIIPMVSLEQIIPKVSSLNIYDEKVIMYRLNESNNFINNDTEQIIYDIAFSNILASTHSSTTNQSDVTLWLLINGLIDHCY